MSSIFKLKTSIGELESANQQINNMKYEQYAPTRNVQGDAFPGSEIRFKIDIGAPKWLIPSRSYLKFKIKLTAANGTTPLNAATKIAPNMNICANLFQSCEFRINEKVVSRISNYVPQISALHTRLHKSDAWLKTIGKSTSLWEPNANQRLNEVLATDGEIIVNGIGADGDNLDSNKARKLNEFDVIWVPPLSIMDVDGALPQGSYTLVLTPETASNFQIRGVEQLPNVDAAKVPDVDYKLKVEEMYFYANTVEGPRIENASYMLDLTRIHCQAEKIKSAESFQQQSFTVSPATKQLTCAFQDSRAGTNPKISASKFRSYADNADAVLVSNENNLKRFYLNFSGVNLPQPDYNLDYSTGKDTAVHLYNDTQMYTGAYYDSGGSEDIQTFRERGIYASFLIPRDGTDRSSNVSVFTEFAGGEYANLRLLLFDHSNQVCKVRIQDSQVVEVELEDV